MKANHLDRLSHSFRIPVLGLLTRTSLGVTMVFYPLIAVGLIYVGYYMDVFSTPFAAFIVGAGIVFWTLFEYLLHRFVFHIGDRWPATAGFQHAIHGVHHHREKDGVLIPPFPGLIITATIFGVNYSMMGWMATYFTAGMAIGYVFYAWIHHNIHRRPPPPLLRTQWRHHTLHHFKYPDKAFGVTSPFWDIIFRTMPPKSQKTVEWENVFLN